MLAELAAANAAYATISKFIANSKEISDALALLKNLVGAEQIPKNAPPYDFRVITGTEPHLRCHYYWLSSPLYSSIDFCFL